MERFIPILLFLIDDVVFDVVVADVVDVAVGVEVALEIVFVVAPKVGTGVFETTEVVFVVIGVVVGVVEPPFAVFCIYWVTREGGFSRSTLLANDLVLLLAVNGISTFDCRSPRSRVVFKLTLSSFIIVELYPFELLTLVDPCFGWRPIPRLASAIMVLALIDRGEFLSME